MESPLKGKNPTFHKAGPRTNTYRVLVLLIAIVLATGFLARTSRGEVKSPFEPTPTPTRMPNSYVQEADTFFAAGKIDDPNTDLDAIGMYRKSLEMDPNDAAVWAKLARMQVYSARMLSTNAQSLARLQEALASADKSTQIDPDNSSNHAIRAFVLDWTASYTRDKAAREKLLTEALDEATRALQLNPDDGMALTFYAEVQLDQSKWNEAEQYARMAVDKYPNLMDTHRVMATVNETLGNYRMAIEEYKKAADIMPNLTFLYILIGVNYRYLANYDKSNFDSALSYFDRAVKINEQLGIKDPVPYIAIAKTYSQMGEFYIASINGEKALALNSQDANTYGQLGIIYFKSKNYESALPSLQCAVVSCTADENIVLQRLRESHPTWNVTPVAVQGLPLESPEIAYYYVEYGQVLAYLSRPRRNYCSQAIPVLEAVRNYKEVDSVMLTIINQSESICNTLQGTTP